MHFQSIEIDAFSLDQRHAGRLRTLRVNTVTVTGSGAPTARELRAAARFRNLRPGQHIMLVPKVK
jgi:hypothetical protein